MYKGQHIQIIQKINNELCLVQLLNQSNPELQSPSNGTPNQKQIIEVQIPINLIRFRNKSNIEGNLGKIKTPV